jgi:soluble P-type ATPase
MDEGLGERSFVCGKRVVEGMEKRGIKIGEGGEGKKSAEKVIEEMGRREKKKAMFGRGGKGVRILIEGGIGCRTVSEGRVT